MKLVLAFTLIELLVVIAVIGVLSGLIVVSMSGVTDKASIAKAQIFSNSLNNYLLINRVAEWKFDETSGNAVNDTVGIYNGTLVNSPTRKSDNDCVSEGCLDFDGTTNSYVETLDTNMLSLFSLSAWIYNVSGGDSRHAVLRYFWEVVGNNLCFWSYEFTNEYWRCSTSNSIPYDKWTLITTTWDGSVIRHYADGKLIWTDPNPSSGTSQQFVAIAGYAGRVFKGRIDDVRIYDAAMPISKVEEIYYSGLNSLFANKGITKEEYFSRIKNVGLSN